jgi:hypothetical protein
VPFSLILRSPQAVNYLRLTGTRDKRQSGNFINRLVRGKRVLDNTGLQSSFAIITA